MMNTAIKTKKAPIKWNKENMITACYYGDRDDWGKAIWFAENGKAYELIYARLAKQYSFIPYPSYDKQ